MRARALTQTIEKPKISVIVEEYRCQNHAMLNKLGAKAKCQSWSIRAVGTGQMPEADHEHHPVSSVVSPAMPLEAIVDEGVAGMKGAVLGTHVCIKANGKQVIPEKKGMGRLFEDCEQEWNYRGVLPGMGMLSPTEKWIPGTLPTATANESGMAHAVEDAILGTSALKTMYEVEFSGQRYPAVLIQQLPDGCLEVEVFMPDENGIIQQVHYPSIDRSHMFIAGATNPITMPECLVAFKMPKENPHHMTLTADGVPFKDVLGRVSPKIGSEARRIVMDVPKEPKQLAKSMGHIVSMRSMQEPISVNVGAAVLRHFLSGEVRVGECGATRLSKWWTIQLGPFAEHKVKIEKKNRFSPILTMSVDDEVLAECSGEDIDSSPGTWHCKFCFIGERHIDFNVFERTKDGVDLDSKGLIVTTFPYKHVVEVLYTHRTVDDLSTAELTIDDKPACQLPFKEVERDELPLSLTREVLASQYGVQVPRKIVLQDTRSMARKLAGRVWQDWEQKNGPVDEVMSKKASETGNILSKMISDTYWFFDSLQTPAPATELENPVTAPLASSMPSLLTSRASKLPL